MIWFLSAVIVFLLGTIVLRWWVIRRRVMIPVERLARVLSDMDSPAPGKPELTLQLAASRLQDLAVTRRQAERDLEVLHSILVRTKDGIIVVDNALCIILVNKAAADILGRSGESLEGKRLTDVFREKQVYDGFRSALMEQKSFEGRWERIEGVRRRVFELRIIPLAGEKAAGVLLDITKLEQLETVRQEFLSNVSHELRTPLTSILAYVETLLDGAIDDRENNVRFLEIIQKHARRLGRLVGDVSDLSAIESGAIRLERVKVNVRDAVQNVMETVTPRAQEVHVSLLNDVPGNITVRADPVRFEQILLNLMDNAVKFNRPDGEVRATAQRSDGEISLSIQDTGGGIPPADLPRVFERFYRVDRARSMELGGTGLGLAIVKHLVRIHGARVSVTSQPGKGTTFTISWPEPKDTTQAAEDPPPNQLG